jgi:HPt (histidine-containing phosphotransfer) domain-containing protein
MSELESSPDFDLSFLTEIADGSTEFIVESIDMFLHQTPDLLNTIGEAIQNNDLVTVAAASHKLKPNLGFFGMTTCQTLMQEIETTAKKGDDDASIAAKYHEAKAIIDPSLIKLRQIKIEKEAQL